MNRVRGRTRTSRSSGAGSSPLAPATNRAQLGQQRLRHLLPRRGRQREGLQERDRTRELVRARAHAPRDATLRSGPTTAASEASSSARSIACNRAVADSSPNPKSMITGPSELDEHVRGAQRAVRDAPVVQLHDLGPRRVEERGRRAPRARARRAGDRRRTRARAPSIRRRATRAPRPSGTRPRPARASSSRSASCSTSSLRDGEGQPSFGPRSSERAVAAVQEIGIPAVASEDLDVARVGRRRRSPRTAGTGRPRPARGEGRQRRTRPCSSAAATVAGDGRRFGAPKNTSSAAPTAVPAVAARSSAGTPALPALAITNAMTSNAMSAARRHERLSHGLPTIATAAAPARYARDGKRVDATHVPLVTASGSRPGRSDHAVEQRATQPSPHPPPARRSRAGASVASRRVRSPPQPELRPRTLA